jgi:carboxymethylenebutenolidase
MFKKSQEKDTVNMSEWIKLTASDGHELDAYVARPQGDPIAGLVVVQEIFGVNSHVRSIADGYAKDGFLVVAPALFDRIEKNVNLGYEGEDRQIAMSLYPKLKMEDCLKDVTAALEYVRAAAGKTGIIGYCFGGTVSWLSATRLPVDAAVGYYAGGIGHFAAENPSAPVMLHFGKLDKHIPKEDIDRLQAAHPDVQVFWYDNADHGFNCDQRSSYQPDASRLARERSLNFLKNALAD